MIKIPEPAEKLINILGDAGFEAFVVGGCVRDSILGREPDDWDICTSALPHQTMEVFRDFRVIETGLKHGTVTVLSDGEAYEITTYRIDGDYSDGRHPDEVTFTPDIEADLARRDFTVNAMAYNPASGLVDPYGGAEDIRKRTLRCVGIADKRFEEDGLRILRAVRFASQLGFEIESATSAAIRSGLELLDNISAERIRVEFEKLLCGRNAENILREYRDVIAYVIPEIKPMFDLDQKNDYHIYDVWEHTLKVTSHIGDDAVLKLIAFFHDIGKPGTMTVTDEDWGHFYGHERAGADMTDIILRRLKYDNYTRETVVDVIDRHKIVFQPTEKHARRCLSRMGEERLRMLIRLELADVKGQNPKYTAERVENIMAFEEKLEAVLAAEQCFSLKHLEISGRDLLNAGVPQGKEIGRILNTLLEMVIDEKIPNEKAALMEAAKSI